jgi:hypothetical protein
MIPITMTSYRVAVFSLLLILTVLAVQEGATTAYAASCTNSFQSGAAAPTGYGAAWNPFSAARELLVQGTDCTTSTGTMKVGSGDAAQYVYNAGYYWSGTQWKKYNLTGTSEIQGNAWYTGSATGNITLASGITYAVGYVCQQQSGSWKCGCRDSTCVTAYWQLQAVTSQATTGTGGGGDGSIQPPPPAAAAGYTRLAFDEEFNDTSSIDMNDTRSDGFKWYRYRPFGYGTQSLSGIQVANGILTVNSKTSNMAILTVTTNGSGGWKGFTATRGAYFEASISFDPNVRGASGWPSFWSMAAEHLWGGDNDGYIETDFMEYDTWPWGLDNAYGGGIRWWGVHPNDLMNNFSTFHDNNHIVHVPDGTDWKQFHTFGTLWLPGQTIDFYFDNVRKMTNPYSTYYLFQGADSQHWPVILGSDNWPMRVDWVRVWQKP